MPGESTTDPCFCWPAPGTVAPSLAPYVVSLNNLYGLITIAPDGGVSVRSEGNVIYIGANGSAGLGTVTSANATSSNSNLVVTGGPITTTGTFAFSLAGALNSLSALVTAADKMPYTTASNTYATTDLTAFARTLLDDANNTAARATLGVVIGTNVQAHSATLDSFSSNTVWTGSDVDVTGGTLSAGALSSNSLTLLGNIDLSTTGDIVNANDATFSGTVTATTLSGAISAANITSGTLAVARGGTNISSYAVGDLIYASGATTLTKLADVAAGSYLRSGGVTTAPVWSTLTLPNTATTGDLFYASGSNAMGRLADVATGNALISGGVGVAPSWGKITSSHVNNTIPTISSGVSGDITAFSVDIAFNAAANFNGTTSILGALQDSIPSSGNSGDILTSTGSGVLWSNQITLDTLTINTNLGIKGTITGAGTTGAQTINKPSGTVNFAAAATSLVVTNSLCTTSHRVQATVCTNDSTMKSCAAVTTTGAFTLYPNVAPTAETAVYWELHRIS